MLILKCFMLHERPYFLEFSHEILLRDKTYKHLFTFFHLTLKWSSGIPKDPKISFCASEYPDATVSWLLHACHPASSGMCLKKLRCALRSNCVRVPMDPPLTINGAALDKNNFPHTRDLWRLYIDVDLWYYYTSILIKINQCFINHFLADM